MQDSQTCRQNRSGSIKKLKKYILLRNKVAKTYNKLLQDNKKIVLPTTKQYSYNAYFSYPILIKNRDKIARILRVKYGIDTRIAYKNAHI